VAAYDPGIAPAAREHHISVQEVGAGPERPEVIKMKNQLKSNERGSAMIMAVFVLALLASVGAALLFITETELKMGQADMASKETFYLSEAGLEDGRTAVFLMNLASSDPHDLDDELEAVAVDGTIDFDPDALEPVWDSDGNLTGFTGYGNDQPLKAMTQLGDGWYAAFLQNDPAEGVSTTVDNNNRVLITAMAVRPGRRVEVTRALVERPDTFDLPPSTITILGPNAIFDGGSSNSKYYVGNDYGTHCPPGTSGESPVVGVIGSDSEASAETGVIQPDTFVEGAQTGVDTVDDLTADPDLPELWTDCDKLIELAAIIHDGADLIGDENTDISELGVPGSPKAVYIEGDYEFGGNWTGAGLLLVTGHLTMHGATGWEGPIFVIGEGSFLRSGSGNATVAGGIIVADVAGPDRILFTSDDCSGEDGVFNTSDDGVAQSDFLVSGGGTGTTGYCSSFFYEWQGMRPFKLLSFAQR
jgi:hypothetical protein